MKNEWKFLGLLFWAISAYEICFAYSLDTHIDPNWHSRREIECGLPYYDVILGRYVDPDDELLRECNKDRGSDSSGDVNRNNDPDRSND